METRRALLLIADIGGYTEYMQVHRTILGHAEAATTRLLKRVVDAARDFDLIEIEGDAVFLSRGADALDGGATVAAITEAAVAMHRAFHAELGPRLGRLGRDIDRLPCSCREGPARCGHARSQCSTRERRQHRRNAGRAGSGVPTTDECRAPMDIRT